MSSTTAKSAPRGVKQERSLAEQAYRRIKRAIIRCEFSPGQHVTEGMLTAQTGLGRAAVRTALNRLCQEGIMRVVARQGHIVAPITIRGVRQLFEIRMLLEPPAVERAARAIDKFDTLAGLEEEARKATYEPGDRDGIDRFLQANTRFHVGVVAAAGNERLTDILEGLFEEMERLFHLGLLIQDRNEEMYHEHRELLEAVLAQDGPRARRLAEEQIRTSEAMVIEALLSSPSLDSVNLGLPESSGT